MKHLEFKQKGVVLLLLLLVFLVAGSSMVLGTFNNRQELYMQQQVELSNQMQLAKEALLAFTANSSAIYQNERGPGFFPCPDTTNTGSADDACNSNSTNLGRLPEYVDVGGNKFFFNSYYAGTNQQFWYAVAPRYVYDAIDGNARSAINRISIDSTFASSRLTLDGTGDIVGLIVAPGEALSFQNRATDPLASVNYLEGGNEDIDADFFTASASNPDAFNDRVITITHDELMVYIGSDVASEIKRLLDMYYELPTEPKHYPGNPDDPMQDADEYHEDFVAALTGHPWLTNDTGAFYEQWADNTIYTLLSATEASLKFKGCPRMSFTLKYDGGIIRDGDSC